MAKYTVELSEEDIQMIKDCHSKESFYHEGNERR